MSPVINQAMNPVRSNRKIAVTTFDAENWKSFVDFILVLLFYFVYLSIFDMQK
jgi:hypothetical protein